MIRRGLKDDSARWKLTCRNNGEPWELPHFFFSVSFSTHPIYSQLARFIDALALVNCPEDKVGGNTRGRRGPQAWNFFSSRLPLMHLGHGSKQEVRQLCVCMLENMKRKSSPGETPYHHPHHHPPMLFILFSPVFFMTGVLKKLNYGMCVVRGC